ncbi:hypothetical protein GCM10023321_81260 [Pseudonocardia eucalypti]|uniref:Secreted protein n=1 Tax=Pseudonocardia eucalypti TaxID=648755 RepID=A0ABP9RDV9_9PSEU|nr:hypothetical protein [Pseudonocardia eucalypti]
MILMSKARRPVRAGFTSSLIAGTALTAALLAPAGVANAQTAVHPVAHSASLAPTQGGESAGGCMPTGDVGFWCPATQAATASSSGSGESAGGSEKKGGGTDIADWILQMTKSVVQGISSGSSAVTAVANALNPVSGVVSGITDLFKTVTGK